MLGTSAEREQGGLGHGALRGAERGGAVAGIAVFAGCEAVTAGAGTLACAAASGAAANAVSYAIRSAQSGSFSWSALGETTAEGAVEGLAGGALGEVASAAGGAVMSSLARDGAEEATSISGDDAGQAVEDADPSCAVGGQSFTAATGVLLASGKTIPISRLKVGDKVKAVNTKSGKAQAETVTAVLVHHDTDLYDLTVKTARGTEVIHTTSNHLFWDPHLRQWATAAKLRKGEHLKTPNGTLATADGGTTPEDHVGWMWDLTVPGNNDHDFYVIPAEDSGTSYYHVDKDGVTAILVHNNQNPVCDISRLKGFAKQIREAGVSTFARNQRVFAVGQDVAGNLTAASSDGWDEGQRDMLRPG